MTKRLETGPEYKFIEGKNRQNERTSRNSSATEHQFSSIPQNFLLIIIPLCDIFLQTGPLTDGYLGHCDITITFTRYEPPNCRLDFRGREHRQFQTPSHSHWLSLDKIIINLEVCVLLEDINLLRPDMVILRLSEELIASF
ncbi:Hypothetical predicted protein [Octopus vulgaris]|uniref:Uncharacterized protein n=1 Tax=Octopus vulgaris TaxID=6645 RepID=A0AA36AVN7_OCTVU|nr:Hypothetical predicted protein [Octopus vulgaris]